MNTYKIEMEVDGEEKTARWYGWDEKTAIAQAMLSEAQHGARSVKILEINKI